MRESATFVWERWKGIAPWAAIVALSLPMFFAGIGSVGLIDPDEPYYALPAREMMSRGSWVMPVFHGHPWFDKPVFFYWLVLAGYHLFGVSEFAARIGSAVSALSGCLAVYGLGRATGVGRHGAFAAALVLATSLQYALMARAAVTDMTLAAALAAGMLAAARALGTGSRAWAFGSGVFLGVATLTKGPVAPVLAVIALGAYGVLARRRDVVGARFVLPAAAGALVSAGPWFAWVAARYPALLFDVFLGAENAGRFAHPEHTYPPFFYAAVLAVGLLPWSPVLPFAVARFARPSRWSAERGAGANPGALFALCWMGSILLVFGVAASKLASYLLPALPAAALLIGNYGAEVVGPRPEGRRRTMARAGLALGAAGVATVAVVVIAVLHRVEATESRRGLVRALESKGLAGEVAGTYRLRQDWSLDFYLGREVARADDLEALSKAVAADPGHIWVFSDRLASELRSSPGFRVEDVLKVPDRTAARVWPAGGESPR